MNKTWLAILSIIAAVLLIFPYLGFGKNSQSKSINSPLIEEPHVVSETVKPAGKNKLSEIEDILNN